MILTKPESFFRMPPVLNHIILKALKFYGKRRFVTIYCPRLMRTALTLRAWKNVSVRFKNVSLYYLHVSPFHTCFQLLTSLRSCTTMTRQSTAEYNSINPHFPPTYFNRNTAVCGQSSKSDHSCVCLKVKAHPMSRQQQSTRPLYLFKNQL